MTHRLVCTSFTNNLDFFILGKSYDVIKLFKYELGETLEVKINSKDFLYKKNSTIYYGEDEISEILINDESGVGYIYLCNYTYVVFDIDFIHYRSQKIINLINETIGF